MALKIRVLGSHQPTRGGSVPPWTYQAEVFDGAEPARALWTCAHSHESPQLAHGCAAMWIEDSEPAAEQTA